MLGWIAGFVLAGIGAAGIIAVARAWRAYLVEWHLASAAVLLVGYLILPDAAFSPAVTIAFAVLFVLAGILAIVRIWLMWPPERFMIPYLAVFAVAATGLALIAR